MRRALSAIFPLLLFPIVTTAQTAEGSWQNLNQLRVGQKIEVVDTNLKKHRGTFLSFSEEAISFRVGKDEVGVQRLNVFRVSSREHSKRLRNALIGLAIGGGIGVAVGAGLQSREQMGTGPVMLLGMGIGAGLGASIPGYQTIYRANRKSRAAREVARKAEIR